MELEFSGEVWEWRGPAPYYFVTVPEDEAQALHDVAHVSYGWGMIPVTARIGGTVDDLAVAEGRQLRRAAQAPSVARRTSRRATRSRWGLDVREPP